MHRIVNDSGIIGIKGKKTDCKVGQKKSERAESEIVWRKWVMVRMFVKEK